MDSENMSTFQPIWAFLKLFSTIPRQRFYELYRAYKIDFDKVGPNLTSFIAKKVYRIGLPLPSTLSLQKYRYHSSKSFSTAPHSGVTQEVNNGHNVIIRSP